MNYEATHKAQRGLPAVSAVNAYEAFGFNLRSVRDTATGRYWFVAKDVCERLGTNAKDIPAILKPKDYCSLLSLRATPTIDGINNLANLRKDTRMISEPGLYRLACRSRKPEAVKFEEWLFDEVLPSIFRHGGYLTPQKAESLVDNPDAVIELALQMKADQERQARQQDHSYTVIDITPALAADK